MVFVSLASEYRGAFYTPRHMRPHGGGEYPPHLREHPRAGRESLRQRPGISPPAGNITKPAGNIPAQPVTFPTGAVIFPPDGNITVGPGGNITVTVKLPASGGNIPGQPVILPGAWDVLPQTGSPKGRYGVK